MVKYSIKKISEMTGFSPATVSNALNNKKGVNKDTAEQILRVAKEVGYVNAAHIDSIKFIICKDGGKVVSDTPFFSALIEGLEQACRDAGFDMVIYNIRMRDGNQLDRLKEILSDPTVGVLLLATELTMEHMRLFENTACALVVLDAWFDQMQFDTVLANNEDSAKYATTYLIEKGHQQIGYLSGTVRVRNFVDRGNGYRRALTERKLPLNHEYHVRLTSTMDGAYKDMCEYLESDPKLPTAYFADNDIIALGAMKALKQFGFKIPRDVSMVGFDDLPFCEISSPTLTTIRFFQKEMGRVAVQRLLEKIKNPKTIPARIQISTKFVERESVRDCNLEPTGGESL